LHSKSVLVLGSPVFVLPAVCLIFRIVVDGMRDDVSSPEDSALQVFAWNGDAVSFQPARCIAHNSPSSGALVVVYDDGPPAEKSGEESYDAHESADVLVAESYADAVLSDLSLPTLS
jgi:hypothetical protein